jgi:glyoxylase-like metal-dependent hydrolase (beta-lactamase superfamily II)
MVPRPLPYPSTHPNKGADGVNSYPDHFFAVYPEQHHDILKRIYWKRRGYFMAVNIPPLPETAQVSSSVWRILGGNPSKFTLQGTNTYLLGQGKERILVDTAQGYSQWGDALSDVLGKCGEDVKIKTVILTHWHHDHVMGIPDVKRHNPDVKVYKHLGNGYDPDGTMEAHTIHDFPDHSKFQVGSREGGDLFEIETLHTPGHAKDHMCLIITESPDPEEIGAMFTADNVLGHGTSVFEDLGQYVQSLKLMKETVGDNKRAFPGHGEVIKDAKLKLDEYITHRQMREDEAMNVLSYGSTVAPGKAPLKSAEGFPQSVPTPEGQQTEIEIGKEWESMEMVKIIYTLYPEQLWAPAEWGLVQVLWKLKGDGKVVRTDKGRWKVSKEVLETVKAEIESQRSKSPSKL